MITSGRYEKKKNPKYDIDIDVEEDQVRLMRAIARGEAITVSGKVLPKKYKPMFKHPLPVSDHRFKFESVLRRVLATELDKQAAGAIAVRNAWVLEEIYMRGAPVTVADTTGFTPLHLAAQLNEFECIMVLLNIGVDVNAETVAGITPLYVARASGARQAEQLLLEKNAKLHVESKTMAPGATILDIITDTRPTIISKNDECIGLPDRHAMY